MGIASLVCGIVSLVMAFFIQGSAIKWIGVILALIGIILGVQGRKDPDSRNIATAGMVCSIIGFIACIIVVIACVSCLSGIASLAKR